VALRSAQDGADVAPEQIEMIPGPGAIRRAATI
jgi:hypothetical protein